MATTVAEPTQSTTRRIKKPSQPLFRHALRTLPVEPARGGHLLFHLQDAPEAPELKYEKDDDAIDDNATTDRAYRLICRRQGVLPYASLTLHWHSGTGFMPDPYARSGDRILRGPIYLSAEGLLASRDEFLRRGFPDVYVDFEKVHDTTDAKPLEMEFREEGLLQVLVAEGYELRKGKLTFTEPRQTSATKVDTWSTTEVRFATEPIPTRAILLGGRQRRMSAGLELELDPLSTGEQTLAELTSWFDHLQKPYNWFSYRS